MTTTAATAWPEALPTAGQASRRSPWSSLVRGRAEDPRWVRPGLIALLAATALLYLVGLSASGWANDYYAAAVQAGSQNWKAFFFGSFDASNYITVDKTPASLWVMGLSARLFGLSSWSLLVPQALMGVATVGVVYAAVRRYASAGAGLVAGAVLASTPVAALMFRFDNPDALLVLLLTIAAYATLRAVESGRTGWLMLAGALVGFGFLTKMLQALLVVPGFALAYLVAGPPRLGQRIGQLLLAGLALLVAGGWWVAIVELIPASSRPYIGGSTTNSILQLTLGYNGLGRITGNETGAVGPGGGFTPTFGASFGGQTGLGRLLSTQMGGEIAWLLPAALIGLGAGLWLRWRAPRTDLVRASLLVWGSWLLVTGLVFSYANGTIHTYYTVALAPAIAALVGLGADGLWRHRERAAARAVLGTMVAATAVTAFVLLSRTPEWLPALRYAVALGGLAVALILAFGMVSGRAASAALAIAALLVGLAGPTGYALATAATPHTGAVPSSGPSGAAGAGFGGPGRAAGGPGGMGGTGQGPGNGGQFPGGGGQVPGGGQRSAGASGTGGQQVDSELVALLRADAGSYRWTAAMLSASGAAPYQLAAGEPILAIGGFNGTDQSTTLAEFQQLVADGKVHYFLAGGGGFSPGQGGDGGVGSQILAWVEENFSSSIVGGLTVYDLTGASAAGGA
jgi:4-amino-4-deoxy-L-arabinose transferase-like glycosyltransferase